MMRSWSQSPGADNGPSLITPLTYAGCHSAPSLLETQTRHTV